MNQDNCQTTVFTKPLIGLYVVSLASGFSMGIFNPLISMLMEQSGVEQIIIGANSSLYYLMIALMAPVAAMCINRFELRATIFIGVCLTSVATILFPFTRDILSWFVLRGLMATGVCLYMIAGQTGLNVYANSERRGLIVALHGAAFGIGFMVSPLIGCYTYAVDQTMAFIYGSASIFLAVFAVMFFIPQHSVQYRCSYTLDVFKKISIPLHGVFIYGLLEGILVTLLPILMVRHAIETHLIGFPLTLFMIASGVGMIPVSYFGDKFGRHLIIFVSTAVALLTLIVAAMVNHQYTYIVSAVLLGLSLGTFFPITLAMIGERLSQSDMHNGSSMFTGVFSLGCAVGPISAAILMTFFGEQHLFSIVMFFSLLLILRMTFQSDTMKLVSSKQE